MLPASLLGKPGSAEEAVSPAAGIRSLKFFSAAV